MSDYYAFAIEKRRALFIKNVYMDTEPISVNTRGNISRIPEGTSYFVKEGELWVKPRDEYAYFNILDNLFVINARIEEEESVMTLYSDDYCCKYVESTEFRKEPEKFGSKQIIKRIVKAYGGMLLVKQFIFVPDEKLIDRIETIAHVIETIIIWPDFPFTYQIFRSALLFLCLASRFPEIIRIIGGSNG